MSGSLSPPIVAVSRLEAALSEVSDMSSTRRHGPTYIWTTLEHIWLQAGTKAAHMTRSGLSKISALESLGKSNFRHPTRSSFLALVRWAGTATYPNASHVNSFAELK